MTFEGQLFTLTMILAAGTICASLLLHMTLATILLIMFVISLLGWNYAAYLDMVDVGYIDCQEVDE